MAENTQQYFSIVEKSGKHPLVPKHVCVLSSYQFF
uniref:Uncharacterized protein n=1 Tax=Arundo donax TaxID=35708 RepID=A0A0A8Z2J6_ARUDO